MSDKIVNICMFCVVTGVVLPWLLLILSAALGMASDAELAGRISAYSAGAGLLVMAGSFFLARVLHAFQAD